MNRSCHLFLGSSSLISCILCSLLTLSGQSSLTSGIPQLSVCTSLNWFWHISLLDLWETTLNSGNWESVLNTAAGFLERWELLFGGITLLRLAEFAWEEDKAGTEGVETVDVGLEGLDWEVLAAGVNGDTDSRSELAGNSSLLTITSENNT